MIRHIERGLTVGDVQRLFCYTPSTGVVIHKVRKSGNALAMQPAGNVGGSGYLQTDVGGKKFLNHRLAWCLYFGEFPAGSLDHLDQDPVNNRIENLRIASKVQNAQNSRISSRNSSGVRGVSLNKSTGRWRVRIVVDGKQRHLGYFDNLNDAWLVRRVGESCAWSGIHELKGGNE